MQRRPAVWCLMVYISPTLQELHNPESQVNANRQADTDSQPGSAVTRSWV